MTLRSSLSICRVVFLCSLPAALLNAQDTSATQSVTLESEGWAIRGDLTLPRNREPAPGVLLLNKAAGTRLAYEALAPELAANGMASLRLDLRGHGESINMPRTSLSVSPRLGHTSPPGCGSGWPPSFVVRRAGQPHRE